MKSLGEGLLVSGLVAGVMRGMDQGNVDHAVYQKLKRRNRGNPGQLAQEESVSFGKEKITEEKISHGRFVCSGTLAN